MGLKTRAKFYYGFTVDGTNQKIDFNEGAGELTGTLTLGDYTLTEFLSELQLALNDAGTQAYTVTVDRVTRFITINAGSNFDLLITSGSNSATSVYSTAGFTGADVAGAITYTGVISGSEYIPQFFLDQYIPSENNRRRTSSVRKESASGKVEVISYGETANTEMNITFITDIDQGANSDAITTDLSGLANSRLFMDFITDIKPIEFIPDKDAPGTFEKLTLLKTSESSDGVDYLLKELFSKGLAEYYETGKLVFRKDQ